MPHTLAAHRYGAQLVVPDAATHVPAPSHCSPLRLPPLQLVLPHAVPAGYLAHVPPPLHAPLVPQLAAPWSAHSLSGSAPVATARHVPFLPAAPSPCLLALHAMHVPAHAVSQQNPSTQLPFAHCRASVHALAAACAAWHVPSELRQ